MSVRHLDALANKGDVTESFWQNLLGHVGGGDRDALATRICRPRTMWQTHATSGRAVLRIVAGELMARGWGGSIQDVAGVVK